MGGDGGGGCDNDDWSVDRDGSDGGEADDSDGGDGIGGVYR